MAEKPGMGRYSGRTKPSLEEAISEAKVYFGEGGLFDLLTIHQDHSYEGG
jgi:hypothetical protein